MLHFWQGESLGYDGMVGQTRSKYLKPQIKAQESEGSPAHISSHLFGKDLGD